MRIERLDLVWREEGEEHIYYLRWKNLAEPEKWNNGWGEAFRYPNELFCLCSQERINGMKACEGGGERQRE